MLECMVFILFFVLVVSAINHSFNSYKSYLRFFTTHTLALVEQECSVAALTVVAPVMTTTIRPIRSRAIVRSIRSVIVRARGRSSVDVDVSLRIIAGASVIAIGIGRHCSAAPEQ